MEKVSVIIPNYNHGKFLEHTIQSVLEQTFPAYEVLICDDGSSDNSKEIVSKFDSFSVRWIDCGRNGRPAIPRNMGISASKGDWIAFLDSDDKWMPNKLELQILLARQSGLQAICCNALKVGPNANPIFEPYFNNSRFEINFKTLLKSNTIICSSTLIKKELFELENNFPEGRMFKGIEDYSLWLKIATKTNWYYLETPLLYYYDNPTQSIRSTSKSDFRNKIITYLEYLRWNKFKLMYNSKLILIHMLKFVIIRLGGLHRT